MLVAAIAVAIVVSIVAGDAAAQVEPPTESSPGMRLTPRYPADRDCSPLTSLFSSWDDVDGSKRKEPHSGVDGGRLGDPILAPADGVVLAVWRANWGWGAEGALLIRHGRSDLGLSDGAAFYYSEFDHLDYQEIRSTEVGRPVKRGEQLATVFRPGGDGRYLPEVHWEVWTIEDDAATQWHTSKSGLRDWENPTGQLVDPLHLLSLNAPPNRDGSADVVPFDAGRDYSSFRGFTYILPCPRKAHDPPQR